MFVLKHTLMFWFFRKCAILCVDLQKSIKLFYVSDFQNVYLQFKSIVNCCLYNSLRNLRHWHIDEEDEISLKIFDIYMQ